MAARSGLLYACIILAFCCWAVQLGGLAALQSSCNSAPQKIADYAAANNLPNVAAVFGQIANYNDDYVYGTNPGCNRIFGFQWWITWFYFFLLVAALFCSGSAVHDIALSVGVLLGTLTAVLFQFCHRYSVIVWNMDNIDSPFWNLIDDEVRTRIQCTYAGYILEAISAMLLLFAINLRANEPRAPRGSYGVGAADQAKVVV